METNKEKVATLGMRLGGVLLANSSNLSDTTTSFKDLLSAKELKLFQPRIVLDKCIVEVCSFVKSKYVRGKVVYLKIIREEPESNKLDAYILYQGVNGKYFISLTTSEGETKPYYKFETLECAERWLAG